MKFLFLLLLLTLPAVNAMGTAYGFNCEDSPATSFMDPNNGNTYFCGYSNKGTGSVASNRTDDACFYTMVNGGTYTFTGKDGQQNTVTPYNCAVYNNVPINSGLIFLIVGGAGLGTFMLRQYYNTQKNTVFNVL